MRGAARRSVRFALVLSLLALIGCAAPRPPVAGATYVLHLPGVAGETPIDHWWLDALRQGGVGDRRDYLGRMLIEHSETTHAACSG